MADERYRASNLTTIQSIRKKLISSKNESIEREERDLHESFYKEVSKSKLSSIEPANVELLNF
jgi:hypothetical protein